MVPKYKLIECIYNNMYWMNGARTESERERGGGGGGGGGVKRNSPSSSDILDVNKLLG